MQTIINNKLIEVDIFTKGQLYKEVMEEIEVHLLTSVMNHTKRNQVRAALILGISRSTLRKKLKYHNFIG